MDIRDRLIAPAFIADGPPGSVDVSGIIHRLLLFDSYILQSIRLTEFPALVDAFGYEAVAELLTARLLAVHCDATSIGQTGQLEILEARREKGLLPLGSFSFSTVRIPDRQKYIHDCLKEISPQFSLPLKHLIKLKRAIVDSLVEVPADAGRDTVLQLQQDLHSQSPLIAPLLAQTIKRMHNRDIPARELMVRVHAIDEVDFAVETNMKRLGFDEAASHKAVEAALLGLSGLCQRLEEMKTYNAVSGCVDAECPLFSEKLGFLLRDLLHSGPQEQFQRVLEVRGIPQFVAGEHKLDVSKFLNVRGSKECAEFRNWLHTLDASTSDKDIEEQIGGFRAKLSEAFHSPTGKTMRFLTSTGVGLVPGIGTIAGIVLGAIDMFLLDRVLPTSGIWTFVNKQYPSIFKKEK